LVTSILVAIDTFPFIQSAYSFRAHSYLRHHCRFALILYKVRRNIDSIARFPLHCIWNNIKESFQ
jgi:hypothetical protein